jgi:ABC-type transport system involved in multi-copper enzyme maturation permease subunit
MGISFKPRADNGLRSHLRRASAFSLIFPLFAPLFGFPVEQGESEAAAAFFLIIVIIIVMFVVWIWVCIWVYRDAKARGMEAVLWLIVVLVGGIIGIILYLIVRHDKPQMFGQPSYQYPPPQYYQPPQYPAYQQQYYQDPYYQDPYAPPERRYPPQPPQY